MRLLGTQICGTVRALCCLTSVVAAGVRASGNAVQDEPKFVLVTGASSNHYVSMMNMIASARETYAGPIVAWDLGLSADEVDDFIMQDLPNL